jgi:penicillin-binding protein 2
VSVLLDSREGRDRRVLRFVAFGMVGVIAMGILTARMFYLQVAATGQYVSLAERNSRVSQPIPSTRGLIYDREGRLLVANVPSFSVKIRPADLPMSGREVVAERLAGLLGIEASDVLTAIDSNPGSRFDLVRIAQDVPEETARLISESSFDLPGVEVAVETRREYPTGTLLSKLIGYTGAITAEQLAEMRDLGYLPDDYLGKAGLEAQYESELRGTYGAEEVERDATGRKVQVLKTLEQPVAGNSLRLTVDERAQKLAQRALEWGIQEAGLKRGVVIAMNPQTGEVLALVDLPTYDNNLFARGISGPEFQTLLDDPDKPLLNHAISENYPPGSTYKLVTATGGLADKEITPSTKLLTKPYLTIGPTKFYEWNRRGWGPCDLDCGFGHSSDTYFFQVAGMLGIDRLAYWAEQYGFGAPTGIDLPGEASGTVPSNQWKLDTLGQPIYPGETYQAGIGQGYDVTTPIQVINAYSAMINGGRLLQPQLVREIVDPEGNVVRPFEPKLIRELPASPSVLKEMREASRNVVTIRHTYNLVDMPIKVAGKSGTAEFGVRDAKGRLPYHSWFVGFVPKDPYKGDFKKADSELVVLAFAYDSRTTGNAATEIVKYFYQLYYNVKTDYRNFDLLERGNFYQSP